MAIREGIKACIEGYKVLFVIVTSFIIQLKESRSDRMLRQMENRFEKYDLVILDKFGYIFFDKEGGKLLFTYLSLRTGRKSKIITTNPVFDRWNELFGGSVLPTALLDRLNRKKAYIINMNGKSYCAKETKVVEKIK